VSATLYQHSRRHLISAFILIGLVFTALSITAIPTLYGQLIQGKNHEVARRSSVESELYGLKIVNILLPFPNHRFGPFKHLRNKYQGSLSVEGSVEYIGLISSLGLIGIISSLLFLVKSPMYSKFLLLTITGILYATLGGFSVFFAILISPQIRCPNRISPYLACFALFWVAWHLQKIKNIIPKKWVFYISLLLLLIIGLNDQIAPYMVFRPSKDAIDSDQKFIQAIELQIPNGSVIQLPYLSFPEVPPVYDMTDYSHLRGYLFSNHLNWSYGAFRGRDAAKKIEAISREPLSLLKIREMGYAGIYIDRYGYANHQPTIETQLQNELKQKPLESINKRFCFYKL